MKIVSWNIACIPKKYNLFGDPNLRINDIILSILEENADIICLQEVFCKKSRKTCENIFKEKGYNYIMSGEANWGINGGLVLATKYKILHHEENVFRDFCGEDRFAKKGFLFTILKNKDKLISCINTHMNADPIIPVAKNSNLTRIDQFDSIIKKIKKETKHTDAMVNVFCGDINTDYDTHPLVHFLNQLSQNYRVQINKTKLKTYFEEQLDYIIFYAKRLNVPAYKRKMSILSDHSMMICNYA